MDTLPRQLALAPGGSSPRPRAPSPAAFPRHPALASSPVPRLRVPPSPRYRAPAWGTGAGPGAPRHPPPAVASAPAMGADTASADSVSGDSLRRIKLAAIPATAESLAPYGQLVAPGEDGDEFGAQDADLDLARGSPGTFDPG